MLAAVMFALVAPVSVGWQLLEVRGLGSEPVKLLVVSEDTVQLDGVAREVAVQVEVAAKAVQEELRHGRRPSAALVRDYLKTSARVPRTMVLRTWLALPEGLVTSTSVSDPLAGGRLWALHDASGERIAFVQWAGPKDVAKFRQLVAQLFSPSEGERVAAEEELRRHARGKAACAKVLVHAAGRTEYLPCGSGLAEMGELLGLLWPEVGEAARHRFGKMLFLTANAALPPGDTSLFPTFLLLRGLAPPVDGLGVAGGTLHFRQLAPELREFLLWELPDNPDIRGIVGERGIPPSDLTRSFPRWVRELF